MKKDAQKVPGKMKTPMVISLMWGYLSTAEEWATGVWRGTYMLQKSILDHTLNDGYSYGYN